VSPEADEKPSNLPEMTTADLSRIKNSWDVPRIDVSAQIANPSTSDAHKQNPPKSSPQSQKVVPSGGLSTSGLEKSYNLRPAIAKSPESNPVTTNSDSEEKTPIRTAIKLYKNDFQNKVSTGLGKRFRDHGDRDEALEKLLMASTDAVPRAPPEFSTLTGMQQAPLGLFRHTPQLPVGYSTPTMPLQPRLMADPRSISMLQLLKLRGNSGQFNG